MAEPDAQPTTPHSADAADYASLCGHDQLIVLANRAPYTHHVNEQGGIDVSRATSGVVAAVEPLVAGCSGVWIARGSGSADRTVADDGNAVAVPYQDPKYRLRYVWLSEEEEQGYYYGFANEGLWPLCHRAFVKPAFREADFNTYWAVNARFAETVADEARNSTPVVFVQDYHFGLAPAMIRGALPDATIVAFWHIPWPDRHTFSVCPWARQLLDGLLGSSIIGFQTPSDRTNFLECVEQYPEFAVDRLTMTIAAEGREISLRVYPASIEWRNGTIEAPPFDECRVSVCERLVLDPTKLRLAIGVDRLDYTKGIAEKFLAVEQLLERYPEQKGRFVLVQIAEPSRTKLPAYGDVRANVRSTAQRINGRFGNADYCPIILLEAHWTGDDVARLMRAADLCIVSSLHEGMNLVSKEFVRSRDDERGVLLLSMFAGASRELDMAVPVNPHDPHGLADALALALAMPAQEQRIRMRCLRKAVAQADAHGWAARIIADATGAPSPQTMMPLRTAYSTTSAVL